MRGYAQAGVVDAIRAAGGEIFAVTSEPQSLASEAEEDWAFGFPSIGDPHHEILGVCRERGWLDLFVKQVPVATKIRPWASHPRGYFQPGVLALSREGRVLYRWRCRPTHQNIGGAIQRPTAEYTWAQIQARLAEGSEDAPLDATPEFDAKAPPWPLFVLMLLAHGWFRRPRPFPLGRQDDAPSAKPQAMIPRLLGFATAWVAAFALLPPLWVTLALVAWIAFVTPGIIELGRLFQHAPTGEP